MDRDRRSFLKSAGAGLAAAGLALTPERTGRWSRRRRRSSARRASSSASRRARIRFAVSSSRARAAAAAPRAGQLSEMKQKYGEITMLDFPQFTKDTFPGVTKMDLFSSLFGDVTDDSMFPQGPRLRSVVRLGPALARGAGQEVSGDRDAGAAHLEQCADQPRQCRCRPAQGRRRDRQALAGRVSPSSARGRCG